MVRKKINTNLKNLTSLNNIATIHRQTVDQIQRKWKSWKYKNTFLLVISLVLFILLLRTNYTQNIINKAGNLGYLGAFIAGVFFVSTFTVAPASVVLFRLAETLAPLEVAAMAGLGAMLGDYIIFRFMKDTVFAELEPFFTHFKKHRSFALFRTPYFAWLLPIIGALIVASPLPDEAGVSLMGLSRIKRWQFFILTLLLNFIGLFLIITTATTIKAE